MRDHDLLNTRSYMLHFEGQNEEARYLRWNNRHLSTYFGTLMTLLQAVFPGNSDLVIKIR